MQSGVAEFATPRCAGFSLLDDGEGGSESFDGAEVIIVVLVLKNPADFVTISFEAELLKG
jgi:hypothetical protein